MTSADTQPDETPYVIVPASNLRQLTFDIFTKLGVPEKDASIAADVLVAADLRGVESHGVSNYMEATYVPGLKAGMINPRPNIRVTRETSATARVDGDGGLGMAVAHWAMNLAIEKARESGAGFVTVANSRHYGMAAYYPMMALPHDMIGITMTNATPTVVPTSGREARLGTNPISLAAPAGEEASFVLDMATSTVAIGKILIANRLGRPIPPGWAADSEGNVTTDPGVALETRRLLPLGGVFETGGHKGYGLGTVVDVLSAVLSGTSISVNIFKNGPTGHFFGALKIDAFSDVQEFKSGMDALLCSLKNTPPAKGQDRVYYAGLIEHETYQQRSVNGIPLALKVVETLRGIAKNLGIVPAI